MKKQQVNPFVENCDTDSSSKNSESEKKEVWGFERKANRSKWVCFNFSSGSTGPAKIQIFKNQVPIRPVDNDQVTVKYIHI